MSSRTFEELKKAFGNALDRIDSAGAVEVAQELFELETDEANLLARKALAFAAWSRGDYSDALVRLDQLLDEGEQTNDLRTIAWATLEIGIIQWYTGDRLGAFENFQRSLASVGPGVMRENEVSALSNIAMIYSGSAEYVKALEYYHRALDVCLEINNESLEALARYNIGSIYQNIGNIESALIWYKNALEMNEKLGNTYGEANCCIGIGWIYNEMKDTAAAEQWMNRGIDIATAINSHHLLMQGIGLLIKVLYKSGRIDKALQLLNENQTLLESTPDELSSTNLSRADIAQAQGDVESAHRYLKIELESLTNRNVRGTIATVHKQLRDLAKTSGNIDEYIKHNELFLELSEEIKGSDATRRVALAEKEREFELQRKEHEKHMAVLHNTLPKHIADRVARGETVNDHFDNAGVMFLDIVGFTTLSSTLTSQQVTTLLDTVFGICDEACNRNSVVRIKTIGDSHLSVSFPNVSNDSLTEFDIVGHSVPAAVCANIANAALQIVDRIKELDYKSLLSLQVPSISSSDSKSLQVSSSDSKSLQVRVGLHCGPITAGVLGKERLQYDVWGDTVNVASRMESTSEPNRIHVSLAFKEALESVIPTKEGQDSEHGTWNVEPRGLVEVKGKGEMHTYWLDRA